MSKIKYNLLEKKLFLSYTNKGQGSTKMYEKFRVPPCLLLNKERKKNK